MESSAFLAALSQMQHMPTELREGFAKASERMTAEQRRDVAAKLAGLHAELFGAQADLEEALAKGRALLDRFRHELVPAIRSAKERGEHAEELQRAESSMNSL